MRRTSIVASLLAGVACAALVAQPASAGILDAVKGVQPGQDIDFKYTGVTAPSVTPLPAPVDPPVEESTFGIGYLSEVRIVGGGPIPIWSSGDNDETVSFMIYGVGDAAAESLNGNFNLFNRGCTTIPAECDGKIHVDWYLDSASSGTNPDLANTDPSDRTGFDSFPGITDGSLLMAWEFDPGILPDNPLTPYDESLTELFQIVASLTLPTTGSGQFYASCVAGPLCLPIDSNAFGNGSDLFGRFQLTNLNLIGSWPGLINDPTTATVVADVSEPATLAMLGAALAAAGFAARRPRAN